MLFLTLSWCSTKPTHNIGPHRSLDLRDHSDLPRAKIESCENALRREWGASKDHHSTILIVSRVDVAWATVAYMPDETLTLFAKQCNFLLEEGLLRETENSGHRKITTSLVAGGVRSGNLCQVSSLLSLLVAEYPRGIGA